jgi:hypothetical protein
MANTLLRNTGEVNNNWNPAMNNMNLASINGLYADYNAPAIRGGSYDNNTKIYTRTEAVAVQMGC